MRNIDMTFSQSSHTMRHSLITLTRNGGPARESVPYPTFELGRSSHMPIDTDIHWDWRNPLNIIPAIAIGAMLLAFITVWM